MRDFFALANMVTDESLEKEIGKLNEEFLRYRGIFSIKEEWKIDYSAAGFLDKLLDNLIHMSPLASQFTNSSLIVFHCKCVKRGKLFRSNKPCYIVSTKQDNILVWEETLDYDNYVRIKKENVKLKSKLSKSGNQIIEMQELKKGMLYNSTANQEFEFDDKDEFVKTLRDLDQLFA